MTPIGHLSVSYITGRSIKGISIPAVMIGGLLPDFDFLFLFFEWFNQIHRVISHNIIFIIVASIVASVFAPRGRKQAVGLGLFLGALTHLFIDSVMDNNPTNGIGIALLWPFTDKFFSPFNLFHASANAPGWSEPLRMIKTLVPGIIYELPFYVISLYLLLNRKEKNSPLPATRG
jgi:membrane-bound metal-dependent hydrolase YbcI (DUF457 family)